MITCTAAELMAALEELPPDAPVAFSSDYGDYYHTQQAHPLKGNIEKQPLFESCYSRSGLAVAKDEDDERRSDIYAYIIS
jgi:hypothetical protein